MNLYLSADILGELLYFSITHEDSQLVHFLNKIADFDIFSAPILGLLHDSDASFHSTMTFPPLSNYDCVFTSVFVDLPFLFIV